MSMLACDEFLARGGHEVASLIHQGEFIPVVAIAMGCVVAMVAIVGGTIRGVVRARAVEQTRRELAAYVAEGTLDPDKAVEILNAGRSRCERLS